MALHHSLIGLATRLGPPSPNAPSLAAPPSEDEQYSCESQDQDDLTFSVDSNLEYPHQPHQLSQEDYGAAYSQQYYDPGYAQSPFGDDEGINLDSGHDKQHLYPLIANPNLHLDHAGRLPQSPASPPWDPLSIAGAQSDPLPPVVPPTKLPSFSASNQLQCSPSDAGYFSLSQLELRSERSNHNNAPLANHSLGHIPRSMPQRRLSDTTTDIQSQLGSMASQPRSKRKATTSDAGSGDIPCTWPGCTWKAKTNSDLTKHEGRHEKKFVCNLSGCPREGKGFATPNDLVRHQTSVHSWKQEGVRFWKCFAKGCPKSEKDWPRKDNFRSHLIKTHPNDDEHELLQQSAAWWDRNHGAAAEPEAAEPSLADTFTSAFERSPDVHGRLPRPTTSHYQPSTTSFSYSSPPNQEAPNTQPYTPISARGPIGVLPDLPGHSDRPLKRRRTQAPSESSYHNQSGPFTTPRSPNTNVASWYSIGTPSSNRALGQTQQQVQVMDGTYPSGGLSNLGGAAGGYAEYSENAPQLNVEPRYQDYWPGRGTVESRARTVANDRDLHTRGSAEIYFSPAGAASIASQSHQLATQNDTLSGVGIGLEQSAGDTIPQIMVIDAGHEVTTGMPNDARYQLLGDSGQSYETGGDGGNSEPLGQFWETTSNRIRVGHPSTESSHGSDDVQLDEFIEDSLDETNTSQYRCLWPGCSSSKKFWSSRSEIKKHFKRHTKPYTCGFLNCGNRFGSKSDCQRHEQHCHRSVPAKPYAQTIARERGPPVVAPPLRRTASTAGLSHTEQPAQRHANMWNCHNCQSDNFLPIYPACTQCDHRRCDACRVFFRR